MPTQTTNNTTIEMYALLAHHSYQNGLVSVEKDQSTHTIYNEEWHVLSTIEGYKGMQAVAYGKDHNNDGIYDEIVIAYRGSDSFRDWTVDDLLIALKQVPLQKSAAIDFYNKVKELSFVNPNANISVTGHSLGGALAQLVAAEDDLYGVTFNAPGMLQQTSNSNSYVKNYINMNDFIGCYGEHYGESFYYLPDGITIDDYKPHSDYTDIKSEKYDQLPEDIVWSWQYALALWGYDTNNNHDIQKFLASGLVTEDNLEKAVEIIQKIYGKTNKLDSSFHYVTPTGINYFIGGTNSESGGNSNDDEI